MSDDLDIVPLLMNATAIQFDRPLTDAAPRACVDAAISNAAVDRKKAAAKKADASCDGRRPRADI